MRLAGIAALIGATAMALGAQSPPVPVFRAESHLVNLSVVATDRSGRPIRDLRASDFILEENGRPQRLLSFEPAVAAPVPPALVPTGGASVGTPAATGHVRYIAFVFDESSTPFQDRRRAIAAVRAWIERNQSPDDLISVISLGPGVRLWQIFTNDRHLLMTALDRLQAQSLPLTTAADRDMLFAMRECLVMGVPENHAGNRVQDLTAAAELHCGEDVASLYIARETSDLETIESVLGELVEAMRAFGGEKRLVYLGDGFRLNPGRLALLAFRMYFGDNFDIRTKATGAYADMLRLLTSAAVRARVTFDCIDTHGLRADAPVGNAADSGPPLLRNGLNDVDQTMPSLQERALDFQHESVHGPEDSLAELAADTGGRAFFGNNDLTQTIERAVGDFEGTYYVSYQPTDQKLDGRYRAITLRSRRPGVHLRTRRGYYADAVQQIPIRVQAAAPEASGGRWQVNVECTIPAAALHWQRRGPGGAVDSLVAVRTILDRGGRVRSAAVDLFRPAQPQQGAVHYTADVIVPAGDYTYLITLTEAGTSNFASVTLPIHAGLPAPPRAVAGAALRQDAPAALLARARGLAPRHCRQALRVLAAASLRQSGAAYALQAECLAQLGDRQRSAFDYERALALGDETAGIHEALGRYYLAISPPLARAHLQRAVALDANRAAALEPLIAELTPMPQAQPADARLLARLRRALAASAAQFEDRFNQAGAVEVLDERLVAARVSAGAPPARGVVIESNYAVIRGRDGRFTEFRAPIRVGGRYLDAAATGGATRARHGKAREFSRYDLTHGRFQGLAFALTLLDAPHQRDLIFSRPEPRASAHGQQWVLGFHRRALSPAAPASALGDRLSGRVWLEMDTDTPERIEIDSASGAAIMNFSVQYRFNTDLGCLAPTEIHASDVLPQGEGEQLAFHYQDFRRFGSQTSLRLLKQ
ncbi:MAG TPA: VWA domain-containing protein [Terriglobales bacterium]|nr:VWA domain-containing protein [Terriglobales bacterium]